VIVLDEERTLVHHCQSLHQLEDPLTDLHHVRLRRERLRGHLSHLVAVLDEPALVLRPERAVGGGSPEGVHLLLEVLGVPLHVLGAGLAELGGAGLEDAAQIGHRRADVHRAGHLVGVARNHLGALDVGERNHEVEHQRADVLPEARPRGLHLGEEVPAVGDDAGVAHLRPERLHLLEQL
jgi:hypothetical protein